MAKRIYPNWLPRLVNPVVMDAATDLRQLRGDYNGGAFAGYAGGYHAAVRSSYGANFPAGGNATISSTAVPAGYVHVIQSVVGLHTDAVVRFSYLDLVSSAAAVRIATGVALAKYVDLRGYHELLLEAGDYLRFNAEAVTAGVTVNLWLAGYSVRL